MNELYIMASFILRNSAIRGIASAVPAATEGLDDLSRVFGKEEAQKIAQTTGVFSRHIARSDQCASDLCFHAALKLLEALDWDKDSIDVIIFVSTTPDYYTPATSCVLQGRLEISKNCAAFDIPLGCSGYIYGLWNAASSIAAGGKRVLLMVGETSSKFASPLDKSTMPLFGDAGTATAIEFEKDREMYFELGTDGNGYKHLIVPAGGFRQRHSAVTANRTIREGGNIRSDEEVFMNGAEIFTFILREVPAVLKKVLASAKWNIEDVDAFVLHQANRFINQFLLKKMKLRPDRVPYSLEEFGNTSSASIPLTISHALRQLMQKEETRLVLCGFGVGLSWGAVALECGPLIMPEIGFV